MIGKRLKILRKKINIKQADLSEVMGKTVNTIQNWESGRANIPNNSIQKICSTFGVSENWLRTGEGDMFEGSTGDNINNGIIAGGKVNVGNGVNFGTGVNINTPFSTRTQSPEITELLDLWQYASEKMKQDILDKLRKIKEIYESD